MWFLSSPFCRTCLLQLRNLIFPLQTPVWQTRLQTNILFSENPLFMAFRRMVDLLDRETGRASGTNDRTKDRLLTD